MTHLRRIVTLAVLACLWTSSSAFAAPTENLFDATASGSSQMSPVLSGFSLGMHFEVSTTPILVTALGFYDETDSTGAGLLNEHAVSIIRTDGTVIAIVTIPAGNPPAGSTLDNGFFYVPITPVLLPRGTDYWIVAGQPTGNLDPNANSHGWLGPPSPVPPFPADSPAIFNDGGGVLTQILAPRWGFDPTAQTIPFLPDPSGPLARYHAGSAQYEVVPEPASLLLLLAGTGLVALRRRRRRRA